MTVFFPNDPPATQPRWADTDVTDPISGINNVVEPTTDYKDNGFYPSRSRVYRPYLNWLYRWIYRQLNYWYTIYPTLDIALASHRDQLLTLTNRLNAIGTIQTSPYPSGVPASLVLESDAGNHWVSVWPFSQCSINSIDNSKMDFWLSWQRIGKTVILHLPQVMGEAWASGTLRSYIQIPHTGFDPWRALLPSGPYMGPTEYADSHIMMPCVQNLGGEVMTLPGYLDIMGLSNDDIMNIWTMDPSNSNPISGMKTALAQNTTGICGFRRCSLLIQLKHVAE